MNNFTIEQKKKMRATNLKVMLSQTDSIVIVIFQYSPEKVFYVTL